MTDEEMEHYSKALDEIYRLRAMLAMEANVLERHLSLKTFPKSRRRPAEDSVAVMRAAARGESRTIVLGSSWTTRKAALRTAGAGETLTRSEWEEEC